MTQNTIKIKRFTDRPVVDSGIEDGVEWCIYEAPQGGTWNGYTKLPDNHPWRNQNLSWGTLDKGLPQPEVHGGITYGPDDEGWIGFDTQHAGDHARIVCGFRVIDLEGHHWTVNEVRYEIFGLIQQIHRYKHKRMNNERSEEDEAW